jgi:hypothetical protein
MKVNRDDFLYALERVTPALCSKGDFEQSTCFLFKGGCVHAFDKKIYCRAPLKVPAEGAVDAKRLLTALRKLGVEELTVAHEDEFLIFSYGRNNRDNFRLKLQPQITLPIEDVDEPENWQTLHESFSDALSIVQECAGKNRDLYYTVCVHVHPKWLEAVAGTAGPACRYMLPTGVSEACIVERDVLKCVVASGVEEVGETKAWLHFRAGDYRLSCRREVESYPKLGGLFLDKGSPITLPASLKEVAEMGEIFSSETRDENLLLVRVSGGQMVVKGEGKTGDATGVRECEYTGPDLEFYVSPGLLKSLTDKGDEAFLKPESILIDGGKWRFISSLAVPQRAER